MPKALKTLIEYLNSPLLLSSEIKKMRQQMARNEIETLQARKAQQDHKSLLPYGRKIYSQCDEDGIIREIFNRIGYTNKVFVEFGIGNGLENNSLSLLFEDWRGLWIEASERYVEEIRRGFSKTIQQGRLVVTKGKYQRSDLLRHTGRRNRPALDRHRWQRCPHLQRDQLRQAQGRRHRI